MLYIHPVVQLLATILAVYVFILGWPRLRTTIRGGRAYFSWQRHVRLGLTALIVLLLGMLGGAWATSHYWGGTGYSGLHYRVALAMAPLMLFGLISGLFMDRRKARRRALPLVHGLVNLAVVLLALFQIRTGYPLLP